MNKKILKIGHILEDTASPKNIIGGGVSYSGIAFKYLNPESEITILTKMTPNHRFIKDFNQKGINVVLADSKLNCVSTFTNIYDKDGNRKQIVKNVQEKITKTDLEKVDRALFNDSMFLVAPCINEVATDVIPHLANYGIVFVTPQGYFRRLDNEGNVSYGQWEEFEDDLKSATATILSEEDITIDGIQNLELLDRIKSSSQNVVLTRGDRGSTIFTNDGQEINITAFHLNKDEIKSFTGAGDCYAAAFISEYIKSKNFKKAGILASLFAAIKITKDGVGVETIPALKEINDFIQQHKTRINEFIHNNYLKSLPLFT